MSLDPTLVLSLAAQCAPGVAPPTLLAVARAESALDPLAIGINGPAGPRVQPTTLKEAATAARALVAAGRDIDLGLGQINVRNLRRLGLSFEDAFDPCRNLAAAGRVLADGYRRGVAEAGPGQPALRIAFSIYNTGHHRRGFVNGYVARVTGPALARSPARPPSPAAVKPQPPSWDSFAVARSVRAQSTFVISPAGATP